MKLHALLAITGLTLGVIATTPVFAASKDDVAALRAEIQALQARLDKMEVAATKTDSKIASTTATTSSKTTAPAAPSTTVSGPIATGQPVVAGKNPNSIVIPGTNTTLTWNGYVKADMAYDVARGYGNPFVKWGVIPLDNAVTNKKAGEFSATARQTRIGFGTETPTDFGPLKVFVETDFYGSNDSSTAELATNPNGNVLRHAYGQLGNVLVGQTWSTFWDGDAHPDSLDYAGPVGVTIVRQVQARYTQALDNNWTLQGAIENPYSDFTNRSSSTVSTSEELPDLVAATTYKDSWGHVSLRGVARRIAALNETRATTDATTGYGLSLSGKVNTFGKDTLRARAVYGDGIGRYMYDVATGGNGNVYTNSGIKTQEVWGGYADYTHFWTDTLRSNLMAGYLRTDNNSAINGATSSNNKFVTSQHANVIWQITPKFSSGVEYMHGVRSQQDGQGGHLDRVMMSGMYNF